MMVNSLAVGFTNFWNFFNVLYLMFRETLNFIGSLFQINPIGVLLTSFVLSSLLFFACFIIDHVRP